MKFVLTNGTVFYNGEFVRSNVFVSDGIISDISDSVPIDGSVVYNCKDCYIFPGFIDVHVHLREPGFFYKETIASGTRAAAAGGFTSVCSMPNLNPVPDCYENLKVQTDIIEKSAEVNVYPYASITKGELGEELVNFGELYEKCAAFSDDGRGVQNEEMMKNAMKQAKKYGKIIAAHCEDNSLLDGGYIHKGEYARLNNHRGISSESEYKQIERDLRLAEETGAKYHVCHISAKESVELIRNARKRGVDVTCETAPHYLVFNDMAIKEEGCFKMNPPIRSEKDRLALIEGIKDGTIDMIATDHAPHSKEEKSKGLEKSLMGVVGLETAFPALYTYLVKTNVISLKQLITLMNTNPKKRFKIGSEIKKGEKADITVFNLKEQYTVNPEKFKTMGRSTPFSGKTLYGKCKYTFVNGKEIINEAKHI